MTESSDDLLRLFDSVSSEYSTLIADFIKDDDYIRGDYGSDLIPADWSDPGLKEPILIPTISDAIDNASDHILTFPSITVPARPVDKDVEKARQISEEKRKFLDMFWHRVFVDQGDPLGRGKRSLVKGKLVLKKEINWGAIPALPENPSKQQKRKFQRDMEKVARSENIWTLKVIPKETVFEDPDKPEDPAFVFESFDITSVEAVRRFPELEKELGAGDYTNKVTYKEYWSKPNGSDRGRYVQWVNDELVHDAINPYSWESPLSTSDAPVWVGYVPYCIGDPGWGDVDSDNDPFDRYVSLTRYIRPLALAESRQLTAFEVALRFQVFKPIVTTNMPEIEDGEKQLDVGPGAVWDKTEDQNIEVLQWGEIPVSLVQYLHKVQQETDRHSKFGALGGSPQRGVDTATEADQNSRNAASKLSGPINTLRRMVIKINSWILQDIEKVLEVPVTLYGATSTGPSETTVTPRDINGFYFTSVELETSDEAALNLSRARLWTDLSQVLRLSNRTAMLKAGIQDPDKEQQEWMVEQLQTSDQAMQVMTMMMLAGLGETGQTVNQAFQNVLNNPTGQGSQQAPAGPGSIPQGPEGQIVQGQQTAAARRPDLQFS